VIGAWLQRHRRSVLVTTLLIAIGGAFAGLKLPVSLFPNIAFPRIVVSIDAGDRPVDRMILEVTQPLEQALRSVPAVQDLRSTSSRGSAEVSVNFAWGTDMVTALLQVQSAVNQVLPTLPTGTTFTTKRLNPVVYPVLGLALTSKTVDAVGVRDFAFLQLRRELATVAGIAHVDVIGGRQEEYEVKVDPARLRAFGLAANDVATALGASNIVSSVGRLEDRYRLYLVLSSAPSRSLADLRQTVLRSGTNGIVTLANVAEVTQGTMPEWTTVTSGGGDAVLLNVYQQPGASTVALVKDVQAKLAQVAVPVGIRIKPYYDQSELVLASETSVRDAVLIGMVCAAVVLFAFLRDWRITIVIALTMPVVLAATALMLYVFGMSFNIMTLGGMAAAVGLIVDDGVVMLEHISRKLADAPGTSDSSPRQTVLAATLEMARPLLGSSLATTVIFLPLAFLSGVSGGFFKALALTMASALAVSFLVAFFALPMVAEWLLAGRRATPHRQPVMDWMGRRYERLMTPFLKRPIWVVPIVLALIAGGWFASTRVGTGFLPHTDEGGFVLDYVAPAGTSLTETDRLLREVEKILDNTPEVDNFSRRTGLALGGSVTEANAGDFFVRLKTDRSRGIDAVMASVSDQVHQQVPGLDIATSQLIEDLIGDLTAVPQPIEIKIFSNDPSVLTDLPPKIAATIGKVKGVVSVKDGIVVAGDAIDIQIDAVRAAFEGLDPKVITAQIQDQIQGTVATRIPASEKIIGVRVSTPGDLHQRIEQLKSITLLAPDGHFVPVGRVAQVRIATGQPQITRENARPMVAVTARIEGRDLGSTVADVQQAIGKMKLPASVKLEYGGLYQQQQQSSRDLAIVFAAAVLLVGLLLLVLYERFAVVASILATSLLTLAGVFAGLWLTGTERNITAMMGMTMIIGMVTEIATFYFADLDLEGRPEPGELIATGVGRMRAILMSALIAILSLSPLALNLGSGAGMLKPLAIAIISGLIVAVPLVLLLMPAIHALLIRRPARA